MDVLSTAHILFAVIALMAGPTVFFRTKGDSIHRKLGYAYVFSMVVMNVTGLAIYNLTGHWNAFHWFALISLLTLICGFIPIFTRRPTKSWLELHYHFMCWSYVGLVAAAFSEAFTRLPRIWPAFRTVFPDNYFWIALIVCIALSMGVGAYMISFRKFGYPPKPFK